MVPYLYAHLRIIYSLDSSGGRSSGCYNRMAIFCCRRGRGCRRGCRLAAKHLLHLFHG